MRADIDVVRDLHQVVDLGTAADARAAEAGAVDGRVGPDLHIVLDDHDAHLRDLVVFAIDGRVAEAIGADDAAVVQGDAGADAAGAMHDGAVGDRAVAADLDPAAGLAVDDHAVLDIGAFADDDGFELAAFVQLVGADHDVGADEDAFADDDLAADDGRGVDEGAFGDEGQVAGGVLADHADGLSGQASDSG